MKEGFQNTSLGIMGQSDPKELWQEIASYIPDEVLLRPDLLILVPGCGYATEANVLAKRMYDLGVPKSEIKSKFWLLDKYRSFTDSLQNYFNWPNVIRADFIEWNTNMQFDIIIGNPPFNNSVDNGKKSAGTGGNSRLYKHFRAKAVSLLKPNGVLAFICLKNIIKDLYKDSNQVDVVNLMTDTEYWKYNTLYFIERNTPKVSDPVIVGSITSKMFDTNAWRYNEFNRTEDRIGTGDLEAIVELPKTSNDWTIKRANVKVALPAAPRLTFPLLSVPKSWVVTDEPFCGTMCGCVTLDTMEEAHALKNLLEFNPAVKYFFKAMKLKNLAKDVIRFTKQIDLSQIKTGYEYPAEWNLTQEEIKHIEESV